MLNFICNVTILGDGHRTSFYVLFSNYLNRDGHDSVMFL